MTTVTNPVKSNKQQNSSK